MATGHDFELDAGTGRSLTAFIAEPLPDAADPVNPTGAAGTAPTAGRPAVIVVHEIMGLNDDIRRIASTFAEHGYVALAPDLLGAGWPVLCIARFMQGVGKAGTGRPYREMQAFHDWLAARPGVDPDRVGMAGFCAGGGFAIVYAARGGRSLRAIAPFYGDLPKDASIIPDVCPVVASYGAKDGMFGKLGPKLEAALEAAGVPHDVKTYPDASHSFMNHHEGLLKKVSPLLPMHAAYDGDAAEDAWARMLAFFGEHLAPRATD